jgi:uncharacterized repeat protein (TIGR03803 family)
MGNKSEIRLGSAAGSEFVGNHDKKVNEKHTWRKFMKNLTTQLRLASLLSLILLACTAVYGQIIPSGDAASPRKASPVQRHLATSGPIVQEQEATKSPTYTVLYTFTGGADGAVPYGAGLIRDRAGNIYGTTNSGGNDSDCNASDPPGCGVIFNLDAAGTETVLYTFTGGTDGGLPFAGLIRDAKGNLYGTTSGGGSGILPAGTVFKLDNTGKETVLYNFCSAANCADGNAPYAGVTRHAGNLYGTTLGGGEFCIEYGGCGVVFRVDRTGNETVLYNFCPNGYGNCTDGAFPQAGLIHDAAGNLYGTTGGGGTNGAGTVFKLGPTGLETVLYSFAGGADGANPIAGLIRDEAGNLYGTTSAGGPSGQGTVFKVDPAGNETVLYSFTGGTDGGYPEAGLVRDEKGNLYGTAFFGGLASPPCYSFCGVVFKVDTTGLETVLYSFTGGADGLNPSAGLMLGEAGNLYGTTGYGGDSDQSCATGIGCGVVFKLTRR